MIPQGPTIDADPQDPAFYQNPYDTYTRHRSAEMVYWPAYEMWCALSFDGVNSLLRDRRFSRVLADPATGRQLDSQLCPHSEHLTDFQRVEEHSLLNLEPPRHSAIRALVNHAFIKRNLESLREEIRTLALASIQSFRDLGRTELLATYAKVVPATVIARMIGVPDSHLTELLDWSNAMVKVYTLTQSFDAEILANKAAKSFSELLQSLVDERRRKPENDLLTHLVHARIDGQSLSDPEVISTVVLLLNAGHEATVHQTGNAVKTILENDIPYQALFDGLEQTRKTIEELMRYDAPLHLFTRIANEDLILGTTSLHRGDTIALLLGAANRDPKRFSNPGRFDPFRTDGGHVSLGAGLHYCIGALLAKMELEIMIPLLFQELPGLKLMDKPEYKNAYHFHGLEALHLGWEN